MGLKLKGKSWAGNIYHQFESLCHDVDDFMSQGTAKLVENQMQNVGNNVKRFYSNVVQEILPRVEDTESTESQSVDGDEHVDTLGHVNYVTDDRTDPDCNNEKQLSADQVSVDTVRNSDASLPIEVEPLRADSSQESETCRNLGENNEAVIWNEIFNRSSDEFDENSTGTSSSSPAFSSREEGNIAIEKEKKEVLSNISSRRLLLERLLLRESKLILGEDSNSDGDISLYAPPVLVASVHKVNDGEDNGVVMDSSLASAADGDLGKDGTLSHSFSTKDEYSSEYDEEEYSSVYEEEQEDVQDVEGMQEKEEDVKEKQEEKEDELEEEMGVAKYSCFMSANCCYILDTSAANVIDSAEEDICDFPADQSDDWAYEMKVEDMLPASLISELLNGDNAFFPTDVQDSLLGLSGMRHEESYKDGQPETAIIPSETGNSGEFGVGIDDRNMETVHLSPKVKPDDTRSVGSNINVAPATSHRRKDFTYYKKLLQNTFTSQKRLSKEYKHLALLHGDIDSESSHNFKANSISSSPDTSVRAMKTLTSHEMGESDWELL